MLKSRCSVCFLLLLALMLAASGSAYAATPHQDEPVVPDTLANLVYISKIAGEEAIFPLDGGVYENLDDVVYAELQDDLTVWGDLDGDGDEDALVVLLSNFGDTQTLFELFPVLNEDGEATPGASILLGDRVGVESLTIDDQGVIEASMYVQGPGDSECCATLSVIRHYRFADDALTLEDEIPVETDDAELDSAATASEIDADADPASMAINLGGGEGMWLNPTVVSAISGVVTGADRADAGELGEGCTGIVGVAPDIVVNWTEDPDVEALRFFMLSNGDPSLVVVTPSGDILCNDDLNSLVPNPMIEVDSPDEGRYAIYVGTLADQAAFPGFLVISSAETNPALFDLGALLPPLPRIPAAVPMILPASTLTTEVSIEATALTPDDLPYSMEVVAGGDIPVFDVETGNDQCTGFVSAEPTFRFTWEGDIDDLVIFAEADKDTTLIVQDPDGAFLCNDNSDGAANLNPSGVYTATSGEWSVWLGSLAPDTAVDAVLTITDDTDAQPDTLPAE